MAKPTKFAHVLYSTRRYEEMIAWYEDVFEAKVVQRDPALAFMTYDDEHHRFAFANMAVFKPEGGTDERGDIGVNHLAYTYANAGELLETYARLKSKGITPYWPVHHGISMSLYYRDPDGNRLEFQADVGTPEQANAYMSTPAFVANPVGVSFDPDRMLAEYRSGAGEDVLLKMPAGEPASIPQAAGLT
jgi:catechol-2,3-dioxygenase